MRPRPRTSRPQKTACDGRSIAAAVAVVGYPGAVAAVAVLIAESEGVVAS